ncbi:MAG: ATP-binding protein [Granulosicoccaceae bacterium]
MTASNSQLENWSERAWTAGVFLILVVAGILLAFFVYKATTSLSEALAEEVLEQQRDVAELLHEFSSVSLAIETYRLSRQAEHHVALLNALDRASEQLKLMRSQYSFRQLDGAAKAHAYTRPVLEDVSYWMRQGIHGFEATSEEVLSVASVRVHERYDSLRLIAHEADEVAQSLISEQRNNLSIFSHSLLFLLAGFAILSLAIFSLLVRQRNMQIRFGEVQQNRNESIIKAESRGRKKAESALSGSEKMLRETLNAIPANIAMIDSEGLIAAANTPWKHVVQATGSLQKNGGIGKQFGSVYHSLVDPTVPGASRLFDSIESVQSGNTKLLSEEFMLDDPNGRRWVEISAIPFDNNGERHTVLVHENVTDRKQLEEHDRRLRAELAHVSRLTSAGELATGLAHELNQPLTAISHNCHSALASIKDNGGPDLELTETLDDIYTLAQRAGDIIRSMRRLTQKGSTEVVLTEINTLIEETIRLTQPDAREKGVEVQLSLLEGAPLLQIDPVQIQQVLVNLERNGVEAMSQADSPYKKLTISTAIVESGQFQISVSDTGPGLATAIRNTLFDTFQTTKKESMGLGLAISRSIVDAHGGRLWVDQNQEFGVTFRFTLPVASKVS